MFEHWHDLAILSHSSPDRLVAEIRVALDSPWFNGHFPGGPILPGVAVLTMVVEMVRHAEQKKNRKVRISGIKRIRFKQPVKPDDQLSIEVSCVDSGPVSSYLFKAMVKNEIACTGVVLVERIPAGSV